AAMPARLAALGDDEVEAGGLEAFRFGDTIRAAADEHALHLEALHLLARQAAEMHGEDAWADLFDRLELRLEVGRVGRLHWFSFSQIHFTVVAGDGFERALLRSGIDRPGLRRDEEVDAEGLVGLRAHQRRLALHLVGL